MLESRFQSVLIRELRSLLPGCFVLKTDANYLPGFPDLLVLYRDRWAALEVKRSVNSPFRPNQEYYIEQIDNHAFGAVVHPDNRDWVIGELLDYMRN